jgi:predicted HAD superfamily Cof-like phosphohydrolase
MAPNDSGLTQKDIDQTLREIKKVKDFIKMIESMGGEVPAPLKTALNRLEVAIKAGKLIAEAADEASKALKRYEDDLNNACRTVDQELRGVCEAKVARQWQARSVKFTLDYKHPDSVTSRTIKKVVQWLTPSVICKHWDYCARAGK